jgi:hypothetical protein
MGDHCTHNGRTTIAGWIHAVYAALAIWVLFEVYSGLTVPIVSKNDLIVTSLVLTPFFYLGVAKFNDRWVFEPGAQIQVAVSIAVVWTVTLFRLWR